MIRTPIKAAPIVTRRRAVRAPIAVGELFPPGPSVGADRYDLPQAL
jgi:hypothetical protein